MRVTLEDIARMANVSKATVSRVLNQSEKGVGEETRQRVQRIIDEMEYRPNLLARGVSVTRTRTLGVIVPNVTNPFFSALVQCVEQCARRRKYTALICTSAESAELEEDCISILITKQVDGVLLVSVMPDQTQLHFRFQKYGIPCVVIDRKMPQMEHSGGVYVDNEYAFFTAAEYLIQNRHRRIAFLSGPLAVSTSKERIEGYRYALSAHGIPIDPHLILVGLHTIAFGYDAVTALHRQGIRFSAILASSDVIAIGAMQALKKLRIRIPEDVEIVGFDNIAFAELMDPPLTTMEQPVEELASRAVEMLLRLIDGLPLQEPNVRLEARLIHRGTTREPPAG